MWVASFILLLPAALPAAFVVHQLLVEGADMRFWVLFLLSLTPCGFVACTLGVVEVIKRKKTHTFISVGNLAALMVLGLGALELMGGLLGIGLVLLVVGALG